MTGTEMDMGGGLSFALLILALIFIALWIAFPVALFASRSLLREILYELRRHNEAIGAPHLPEVKNPGKRPGRSGACK